MANCSFPGKKPWPQRNTLGMSKRLPAHGARPQHWRYVSLPRAQRPQRRRRLQGHRPWRTFQLKLRADGRGKLIHHGDGAQASQRAASSAGDQDEQDEGEDNHNNGEEEEEEDDDDGDEDDDDEEEEVGDGEGDGSDDAASDVDAVQDG